MACGTQRPAAVDTYERRFSDRGKTAAMGRPTSEGLIALCRSGRARDTGSTDKRFFHVLLPQFREWDLV